MLQSAKKRKHIISSPLQTLQLPSHFRVGADMILINCRINPTSNAALEWRRECPEKVMDNIFHKNRETSILMMKKKQQG
jgi:hypothetical protein